MRVRGTVQGVGFRPTVWRLARQEGVAGSIVNDGELPFDLHWDVGANPRVRVVPEYASVGKGERAECELSYAPGAMKLETLENYPVRCSIVNGRTYDLRLSAEGHKPAVRFSFRRFDFGPTHVVQGGGATRPRSRVLGYRIG